MRNRFDYIEPRDRRPWAPDSPAVPGQLVAVTAAQPAVPDTRGEKTVAAARARLSFTVSEVGKPDPPLPPKVIWPQTRLEAPYELTVSRSRTQMLSEKIGRQNG